jgi:hypothetical protein
MEHSIPAGEKCCLVNTLKICPGQSSMHIISQVNPPLEITIHSPLPPRGNIVASAAATPQCRGKFICGRADGFAGLLPNFLQIFHNT